MARTKEIIGFVTTYFHLPEHPSTHCEFVDAVNLSLSVI